MSEFFPFQKPNPEEHRESMVYVTEEVQWEYKVVTIDLSQKQSLSVEDLNQLGKDSWELSAVLNNTHQAIYYFKRPLS